MPKKVENWLKKNFAESTADNYRSKIDHYEKFAFDIDDKDYEGYDTYRDYIKSEDYQGETLDDYLKDLNKKKFQKDFEKFVDYILAKNFASYTTNQILRTVKMFFKEHGFIFPEEKWSQIRRRKLQPGEKETYDKAGSIDEWKKICKNLNIAGRSLVLFLLTSGCRIGETLELKVDDFNFNSDPPEARIRSEYSKNNRPRTVYFTEETKEEIQDWLRYRKNLKKKGKSTRYDLDEEELSKGPKAYSVSEKVWPIAKTTAREMLYRALKKSGLEDKDPETGNRKIHFHSTRMFFKTNLRGMDEDVVEYLLGHKSGIRGTYRKYQQSDIPKKQYKNHCDQLDIWKSKVEVNVENTIREEQIDFIEGFLKGRGVEEKTIEDLENELAKKIGGKRGAGEDVMMQLYSSPTLPQSPFEKLNLGELSKEEFRNIRKELLGLLENKKETKQKVIPEAELEEYLENGWKYVDQNNGGKVIVEK